MAAAVYVLCTITALACAILLLRGYLRTRSRLLLWSAVCFAGLMIDNALVFVDLLVVPNVSLIALRLTTTFLSVGVLLVGLVFEGGGTPR